MSKEKIVYVISRRAPVLECIYNEAGVYSRSFASLALAEAHLMLNESFDTLEREECGDGIWAYEQPDETAGYRYLIVAVTLPEDS